ncbi:MAG TPA: calcium-binding protein [Actinomycetota bacterium]|nr:calcium-binding protein [Actinomycetota bacterium]
MRFRPARTLILLAIAAGLLPAAGATPVHASHDGQARRCFGAKATIVGTNGDDVILGGPGRDVIVALGGDDDVYGLEGHDALCAGAGDDRLDGGPGVDFVASGDGADEASGGGGSDFVAEDHALSSLADTGADSSADSFSGGGGDDIIADDPGEDVLDGGPGTDTFFGLFSNYPLMIDLRNGRVVTIAESNALSSIENAIGSASADVVFGDERPNVLTGFLGSDVVFGAGGGDILFATVDGDVLDGGGGRTSDAVFALVSQGVQANLDEGTVTSTGRIPDRMLGVEDFLGTAGDDVIVGSGAANRLYGGGGDDLLDGVAGDDSITGDSPFTPWVDLGPWKKEFLPRGRDTLDGGDGNDLLDGGPLADTCTTGERLRHCESRKGEDTSTVARSGVRWHVPAPLRAWLLRMMSAESPSEVVPPVWRSHPAGSGH